MFYPICAKMIILIYKVLLMSLKHFSGMANDKTCENAMVEMMKSFEH